MLNKVLKICEKKISADVKANKNKMIQKMRWLYLINFYKN